MSYGSKYKVGAVAAPTKAEKKAADIEEVIHSKSKSDKSKGVDKETEAKMDKAI